MRTRNVAGLTFLELLIALVILTIIAAGLIQLFTSSAISRDTVVLKSNAEAQARRGVDIIADHLRNAQVSSGSLLSAASATGVTYYTDSTGSTVRYFLDGTDLKRTDSSGTTVVLGRVQSLTLTYYTAAPYTSGSSTPSTLSDVEAVSIDLSVTMEGYVGQYTTIVKLRNSL